MFTKALLDYAVFRGHFWPKYDGWALKKKDWASPHQPWRLIELVGSNSADVHWDVHQGTVPLQLGKGSFDHVPIFAKNIHSGDGNLTFGGVVHHRYEQLVIFMIPIGHNHPHSTCLLRFYHLRHKGTIPSLHQSNLSSSTSQISTSTASYCHSISHTFF